MSTTTPVGDRRLLVAAVLAAVTVSAAFSGLFTGVVSLGLTELVFPDRGAMGIALAFLGTWLTQVLWHVPYLVVVLRFLAEPSRESAVSGAIIIYAVGLLLAWLPGQVMGAETTPATAVVPLGDVAAYLAVVTAVWLAYHGGVERVVDAVGRPPEHPVTAIGAETCLTPELHLQRGVFAAVAAALVGTGGRLLTGVLHEQVQSAVTSGIRVGAVTGVGLTPEQVPAEMAFEAAFLLAILLVTGPRVSTRAVLKAAGVIVGMQVTVAALNALFVADPSLVSGGGPLLRPVAGLSTLLAIAAAVWLAFHGGVERVAG